MNRLLYVIPLLALPIDLDRWCGALPDNVYQHYYPMEAPNAALPTPRRGIARAAPASGKTWEIDQPG